MFVGECDPAEELKKVEETGPERLNLLHGQVAEGHTEEAGCPGEWAV